MPNRPTPDPKTKERALEALLVLRAKGGNASAMDALVRLRGPRLLAHATRLLGDREGARDVAQEAWVDILRGLPGLKAEGAFLPWALQIVTRKVAREIARRQRGRQLAADVAAEPQAPDPAPEAASDADKLRAAIAQLPPAQSATVALFYLEDMSVADVAAALDVPIGTVKTRLMHARAKLAAALKGEDDGQD